MVSAAGALSVWGEGIFNFSDSYIDNMDSKGFCNGVEAPKIIHAGNGLTCEAKTVTVKAFTNIYNGSCSLSLDAVTLDVVTSDNPAVTDSTTFTGSTTTQIAYTKIETVILSLANPTIEPTSSTVCNDNSTDSRNMLFVDAGFRFISGSSGTSEVINNQIADINFPIRLQAVKNSDGICTYYFTDDIDVKLAKENVNPLGTTGLKFNGNDIDKYPSINSSVTLNFGSNSIATITLAHYKDAGRIRLRASYTDGSISLVGTSQSFWVRPNQFVITAQSSGSNLDGTTSSSSTVHKAGENFNLVVTAYNSLGTAAENITKNYQQGQMQLKLTRVKPTIAGSVEGSLTYISDQNITSSLSPNFSNNNLTAFLHGISSFSNAQFSEVGIINCE
jgi:MSHA biogenesis protein MshQ